MYKKKNTKIRNIKEINEELYHRDYCNARLNALFLSNTMGDKSSIHSLVHRKRPSTLPILKAFFNYYNHRNLSVLLEDIDEINKRFPGLNNFAVLEDDNGKRKLIDNTEHESNWTDLKNYDIRHNRSIEDTQVYPHRHKRFKNNTPIEIIKDTIDFLKHPVYNYPVVSDKELSLLLGNLYYTTELNERAYHKALILLNNDIIKTYKGQKPTLEPGHIDAFIMMEDLSSGVFSKIDYPRQYGFYKTPLCRDMLKFSYLTTFIKKYPFDEQDMNTYLNHIQDSGHWLQAHRRITNTINRDALQLTGINYGMIELSTPRPLKEHNSMLNHYLNRDLERIKYQNLYLEQDR